MNRVSENLTELCFSDSVVEQRISDHLRYKEIRKRKRGNGDIHGCRSLRSDRELPLLTIIYPVVPVIFNLFNKCCLIRFEYISLVDRRLTPFLPKLLRGTIHVMDPDQG